MFDNKSTVWKIVDILILVSLITLSLILASKVTFGSNMPYYVYDNKLNYTLYNSWINEVNQSLLVGLDRLYITTENRSDVYGVFNIKYTYRLVTPDIWVIKHKEIILYTNTIGINNKDQFLSTLYHELGHYDDMRRHGPKNLTEEYAQNFSNNYMRLYYERQFNLLY